MAEAGVDWLVEIPFTRDLSTLVAQEFLDRHILVYPRLEEIFLGWDFAFGAHKSAGAEDVRARCVGLGIKVEICPRYDVGGQNVSSTRIREALAAGDVVAARGWLGRPFTLEGLVVKGEGRGKRIGVPTANLRLNDDLMLPRRGVYVTETASRGMVYRSVTNVGINPTFLAGHKTIVETHILDFDGDIYGETIEVRFLARLRDEQRFANVGELVAQIHADRERARVHRAD
jgi:riboflavin kinase/FMN adenylyltransferase